MRVTGRSAARFVLWGSSATTRAFSVFHSNLHIPQQINRVIQAASLSELHFLKVNTMETQVEALKPQRLRLLHASCPMFR